MLSTVLLLLQPGSILLLRPGRRQLFFQVEIHQIRQQDINCPGICKHVMNVKKQGLFSVPVFQKKSAEERCRFKVKGLDKIPAVLLIKRLYQDLFQGKGGSGQNFHCRPGGVNIDQTCPQYFMSFNELLKCLFQALPIDIPRQSHKLRKIIGRMQTISGNDRLNHRQLLIADRIVSPVRSTKRLLLCIIGILTFLQQGRKIFQDTPAEQIRKIQGLSQFTVDTLHNVQAGYGVPAQGIKVGIPCNALFITQLMSPDPSHLFRRRKGFPGNGICIFVGKIGLLRGEIFTTHDNQQLTHFTGQSLQQEGTCLFGRQGWRIIGCRIYSIFRPGSHADFGPAVPINGQAG